MPKSEDVSQSKRTSKTPLPISTIVLAVMGGLVVLFAYLYMECRERLELAEERVAQLENEREIEREKRAQEKPIIYLYPEKTTDISVALHYTGKLTCTYPPLGNGWRVTAQPDGTLINHADKKEYSYLFWEGESDTRFDMSRGFVVAGKDTAAFLQEKLAFMGLTPREYNEFIVYWLPQMQDNPYNLITFQDKDYTDQAKLVITPNPDSLLRVFMVYKPLHQKITVPEQALKPFTRTGFTVVEWGGGMQGDEGALNVR